MSNHIKTFEDLEFKHHPAGLGGRRAEMEFKNGYGVSVVSGAAFYTSPYKPFELAVMVDGECCYDTPITEDVIGYQTEEEITELMAKVQNLEDRSE